MSDSWLPATPTPAPELVEREPARGAEVADAMAERREIGATMHHTERIATSSP